MAQTYSTQLAGANSLPVVKPSAANGYGSRLKRFPASIPLTAQNIGDTVVCAIVPAGHCFAGAEISTDTSLGTAMVELGNATLPAKYAPAQVLTAVNAPALLGTVAALAAGALTAQEVVLLTVGVAALPAAGNLQVELYFSNAN